MKSVSNHYAVITCTLFLIVDIGNCGAFADSYPHIHPYNVTRNETNRRGLYKTNAPRSTTEKRHLISHLSEFYALMRT